MIYRPAEGERLWDSWLFPWDGKVHLFYLASQADRYCIGHAVSTDLVHWSRLDDILPPHWPYTGLVLRDGDRFVMALGECVDHVQTNVFYESDDLETWRPLPGSCRLRPAGPHYVAEPSERWPEVWWRDPFLFRPAGDDAWHALLCASRPAFGPDHSGAVLAHVRTRDFASWENLPPLDAPTGRFYHNEVPEHFEHEGRHYVLFSTGSCAGIRIQTPGRRETCGTYYMMADRLTGPYRLPADPLLVGAGYGRLASYVGRVVRFGGERLLYSHIRDDSERWEGAWAAPKRLDIETDGTLAVRYWPGLAALETRAVVEDAAVNLASDVAGTSHVLAEDAADVHVQTRVRFEGNGRCGVILRSADGLGMAISLDFGLGQVAIGVSTFHPTFGWGADVTGFLPARHRVARRGQRFVLDTCGATLAPGRHHALRCLARGQHVEVYLQDRWVFTTHVPEAPASGRVELFAERGRATFDAIRLSDLEPWSLAERVGERAIAGAPGQA